MNDMTHTTILCALIHYALHVADPTFCVEALNQIHPDPLEPWADTIANARGGYRELLATAETQAAA